jgi:signal recognition particle subunit SRP54
MEARMRKGQFTFDDFLQAQKMLRRMGPLQGLMKMIPGMGAMGDLNVEEGQLKRVEGIVLSMTPRERSLPHTIDGGRRQRIARGSGTTVEEVNRLLEARKMMEKVMKQMGSGKMPSLPGVSGGGMPGMPGMPGMGAPGGTRHPGSKKRNKSKRKSKRR